MTDLHDVSRRGFIGARSDIPVRVDADDPKRYRVDIGWLPKKAICSGISL